MKHRNVNGRQQRMWLNCLLIVFLNTYHLVDSLFSEPVEIDPEDEWDSVESLIPSKDYFDSDLFMPKIKAASKPAPPLKLPFSVRIKAAELHKELFAPERGFKPMPQRVKSILLPQVPAPKPAGSVSSAAKTVEVLCHFDRMLVRVLKSFFTRPGSWRYLKLGTCAVNKATATHYYFLYYLKGCDIKREEDANRVTYKNTLRYEPAVSGLIVRDLPFSMSIGCSYTKFHRSYQVGFIPKVAGGTLYRGLQTDAGHSIVAMDESWNLLVDGKSFVLGKPICFEAKAPNSEAGKRLYLNRCFVTSSPSPLSKEKYAVVENYGCLVDSKNSVLTKFHTSANKKTVRLCVEAFLFKNMVSLPHSKKTMFMHCELDFGPQTPTPSAKACTYNGKTKNWTELYGDSTVCNCCESTCSAPPVASGKTIITSDSWNLKMGPEALSPPSPEESVPEFLGHGDFELFWESDDD
ncbi:zona pellucida sperm-binding protein 3 [Puntigrus tetrazona]|uniref:zona pellucida sperm-binding protein 3 n=1 Tax=Puntigrus tetrazona TaxID=1606681 RepID=UPI001C8AC251|nr:zona pellucida sperm-binding protein 3 [Puntigrus tetrazona]